MALPDQPRGLQKHSRRSHRKSRAGCGNCKKRRIKCDETKPECQNCASFGVQCDYRSGTRGLQDAPLERYLFSNSQGPPSAGKRGRPRTKWHTEELRGLAMDGSTCSGSLITSPHPDTPSEAVHHDPSHPTDHHEELRLLHHFLTREYEGAAAREPPSYDALRLEAPNLGFAYPFVLHLVYEFAALDYARLQPPERRQHYRSLAAHYSSLGLKGVTSILPQLDSNNCHAIYTAAVFACMNAFARGPQPGEYLLFSEHGPPQWIPLLRGVRTIIEMVGIEKLASGPREDKPVDPEPTAAQPAATAFDLVRLDWVDHFHRLEEFVSTPNEPDSAMNLDALSKLRLCYEATFGGADGEYQGNADYQNMFIWTYRLDGEFATFLQEKRPMALIILAHFALLLKNWECIWFLEGWADHVIAGVGQFVDDYHRVWLQWPIDQADKIQKEKDKLARCRTAAV